MGQRRSTVYRFDRAWCIYIGSSGLGKVPLLGTLRMSIWVWVDVLWYVMLTVIDMVLDRVHQLN